MCAHTSLGTQPIYLFGTDEQKERVAAGALRAARKLGAFGLTEPEAGSDAGNITHPRATLDDGEWVDQRRQAVHHQRRAPTSRGCVTITAVTGAGERRQGDLEPHRPERHPRLRAGRALPQDGLERLRHAAADLRPTAACPRRTCSARAATGFKQFLHILDSGRIGVAAMGVGLAQGALDEALAYAKERRAFGQPISQVPGDPGQARRHVDRDRGGAPAHLQGGDARRTRARTSR